MIGLGHNKGPERGPRAFVCSAVVPAQGGGAAVAVRETAMAQSLHMVLQSS